MKIKYVTGSPTKVKAGILALCVYSDGAKDATFKAVDKALDGRLTRRLKEGRFGGKIGESRVVNTDGLLEARRVILLGAGAAEDFKLTALRELAAAAGKATTAVGSKRVAFVLPGSTKEAEHSVQMVAEGLLLGAYQFDKYKAEDSRTPSTVKTVELIGSGKGGAAITKAIKRAEAVAEAVNLARDLVNEPAAAMTPRLLAAQAKAVAKAPGLSIKVVGPKECEKLGMGMFLAVGQGSDEEVRLIHMTYKPKKKAKKVVALVGKGVTFDSGGYSLKPSAGMVDMKIDMAGSAAVISAMGAIAALGCDYEVHAVVAAAENLVSGNAYKLGDVLTAMDGTTVEINNTDAEGRLTLGDAITYAREKIKADEIFDFATLTGACVVALGPYTAAVLSNNEELAGKWMAAADVSGEDMWRMPLNPRLREQLKSPIADMKNTGGRAGGTLTAGLFLQNFAKETPWVHVDIAGPATSAKTYGCTPEGGTGYAVATIVDYLTR